MIIGLDLGSVTCGVAQSDVTGTFAIGVKTLRFAHEDYETAVDLVVEMCKELKPETVVVGYPILLNGQQGTRAQISKIFAEVLEEELNTNVVLWDERFTTIQAEKTLLEGKVKRKKRREIIDKVAATYILQGYLDQKNNRREEDD